MLKSPGELQNKITFQTLTDGEWSNSRYEFAKITELDTFSRDFVCYHFALDQNTMRIVYEDRIFEIIEVVSDGRYLTIKATDPDGDTIYGD